MSKKIITSIKGRKCKFHGCKHILSVYNHGIFCRIHTVQSLDL
ncbi:MAG: hypothetical protein V2A70_03495 [Candidatus Omnitrophota bacterium]